MAARLSLLIVAVSACCAAMAQQSPPKADTAGTQSAIIPDLCKEAVDPYDAAAERQKFFQATGVETELTEAMFAADAKLATGFVRVFDRWKALLPFDKNANGKIDWFEADAYRQDIRKKILAAFDKDKDGKLTGAERDEANKFLLAGKLDLLADPKVAMGPIVVPGPGIGPVATAPAGGPRQLPPGHVDLIAKYDKDGDGKLSDEEAKPMYEEMRRQSEQLRKERELRLYDKNKDGVLDEAELAAIKADQERIAKETREHLKKAMELHAKIVAALDANNDGTVTTEERQAKFKALAGKYDTDGDGKFNPEGEAKMWKAEVGLERCPRPEYRRSFAPVVISGDNVVIVDKNGNEGVIPTKMVEEKKDATTQP